MCEVTQDPQGNGRDRLVLLARDQWVMGYFVHGGDLLVHLDIATPPTLLSVTRPS